MLIPCNKSPHRHSYTRARTHIHTCTHIYTHIHTHIYTHIHTLTQTLTYAHIRTQTYAGDNTTHIRTSPTALTKQFIYTNYSI